MRIARDLHDVIAHHLALANAQAGTVIYLMDTKPGTARTMAGDLGGTIVAALEELKTTVSLLRQADDPESPLEPAPGAGAASRPGRLVRFRRPHRHHHHRRRAPAADSRDRPDRVPHHPGSTHQRHQTRPRKPGPGPAGLHQALLRQTFRILISATPDMEVVGEAADGKQAAELARTHHPDVVVMDIRMPGTDGLAATETICADPDLAGTRILILTTFETEEYVARALRAGASGFLGKTASTDDLLDGIRTIAAAAPPR
jgi:CheY-like chemotaxis protein